MLAAIKHGLGNLLNFDGRDARQAFWFYVLFLYLVTVGIGMIVSIPMTMQSMMLGMQQSMAHAGDPAAAQAAMSQAMLANFERFMPLVFWTGLASAVILLLALSAALVRRLHDSGLSGYWAALPAAFQIFAIASMPAQVERARSMMAAQVADPANALAAFKSMGVSTLIGWAPIALVIVFGIRGSSDGPNRFGDAPFVA